MSLDIDLPDILLLELSEDLSWKSIFDFFKRYLTRKMRAKKNSAEGYLLIFVFAILLGAFVVSLLILFYGQSSKYLLKNIKVLFIT